MPSQTRISGSYGDAADAFKADAYKNVGAGLAPDCPCWQTKLKR